MEMRNTAIFLFSSYELKMSAYILLRNTLVVSFSLVLLLYSANGEVKLSVTIYLVGQY
jgi:hypothetical protein